MTDQKPFASASVSSYASAQSTENNLQSDAHLWSEEKGRKLVEALLKVRRQREKLVANSLAEDSAFLMMLELYLSHVKQYDLTVTALCAATDAPTTTALRRIDAICDLGFAARCDDRSDSRRINVTLTAKGLASMTTFLQDTQKALVQVLQSERSKT